MSRESNLIAAVKDARDAVRNAANEAKSLNRARTALRKLESRLTAAIAAYNDAGRKPAARKAVAPKGAA